MSTVRSDSFGPVPSATEPAPYDGSNGPLSAQFWARLTERRSPKSSLPVATAVSVSQPSLAVGPGCHPAEAGRHPAADGEALSAGRGDQSPGRCRT